MNTQFPQKTYKNFQQYGKQSGCWFHPEGQPQKLIYLFFSTRPYEPLESWNSVGKKICIWQIYFSTCDFSLKNFPQKKGTFHF